MCTFEIWKDNEILVDNLNFEDAAEQIVIYENFFGGNVFVVCRCTEPARKMHTQTFKAEYFSYMDELYAMGNL